MLKVETSPQSKHLHYKSQNATRAALFTQEP